MYAFLTLLMKKKVILYGEKYIFTKSEYILSFGQI